MPVGHSSIDSSFEPSLATALHRAVDQVTPLPKIGAPATRALHAAGYFSLESLNGVNRRVESTLHGVEPRAIRIIDEAMTARGLGLKN